MIALPTSPIFGGTKHWMPAYPFMALYAGAGFALVVRAMNLYWRWGLVHSSCCRAPSKLHTVIPLAFRITPRSRAASWGAADKGMNRQFWGFTTGSLVPWLKEKLPNGGRVWICDTTWGAWHMLQRDGLLPNNIRATQNFTSADLILVHHEQHFAEVDFQAWVATGTVQPVHVLTYDGVPIISVYERPTRRSLQPPR